MTSEEIESYQENQRRKDTKRAKVDKTNKETAILSFTLSVSILVLAILYLT